MLDIRSKTEGRADARQLLCLEFAALEPAES